MASQLNMPNKKSSSPVFPDAMTTPPAKSRAKKRLNKKETALVDRQQSSGAFNIEFIDAQAGTLISLNSNTEAINAIASTVQLDPGLYAIDILGSPGPTGISGGVPLPLIRISQPPSQPQDRLEIVTASANGESWLDVDGDLVIVRSPATGGQLIVTVFGAPGQIPQPASVTVRRLNRPVAGRSNRDQSVPGDPLRPQSAVLAPRRELSTEILLHIERAGDCLFPGSGWVGNRGKKIRVEGFSIRALAEASPRDIHYKGLLPRRGETGWVEGPQFCGSRGRGLPLVGFAIRLAPRLNERFEVEYYGAFFNSGICGPSRDGELCLPRLEGDPLEAINFRIRERNSA